MKKMNITANRDTQIDALKAFGIICVVAGHTGSPFANWVYSFHMGLFFFVSGFLRYKTTTESSWKEFIAKKIKTSIIPYILFWCVSLIYSCLYNYLEYQSISNVITINSIKGLLLGGHWLADYSINFALWYLQLYFIATIVLEFIVRYFNKYLKIFTFIILLIATIPIQQMIPGRPIFHINVLPAAILFMLFGYFIKHLIDKFKLNDIKQNISIGSVLLVIGWYFSVRKPANISAVGSYSYIIGAFLLILGFYIISNLFSKNKMILYIGSNTLYILGLHSLATTICRKLSSFIFNGIGIENVFLENSLLVFLDIIVCCGMAEIFLIFKKNILNNKIINLRDKYIKI